MLAGCLLWRRKTSQLNLRRDVNSLKLRHRNIEGRYYGYLERIWMGRSCHCDCMFIARQLPNWGKLVRQYLGASRSLDYDRGADLRIRSIFSGETRR